MIEINNKVTVDIVCSDNSNGVVMCGGKELASITHRSSKNVKYPYSVKYNAAHHYPKKRETLAEAILLACYMISDELSKFGIVANYNVKQLTSK